MLKEVNHIFRDTRTLVIVFLMPVMQLIIFGYAMNMELSSIRLGCYDYSHSKSSRAFVQSFSATESFDVSYHHATQEINTRFFERSLDALIIIPHDFETELSRNKSSTIQLIIDASDPNAATLIRNYAQGVIIKYSHSESFSPIQIKPSILYNPDLKSAYFFVPGLIAMILVMISALLTSIAITREKELGTMEQILVSPIKAHEIMIGKVLPYIALALLDALFILGVGMLLFQVPFSGNFLVFLFYTLLYVIMALSLGLMISTIAKSQQAAMMFAITLTMLPTMMLSGFIFPIASMPKLLQMLTWLVPAKYYLQIIRGIMLKGNSLAQLFAPGMALLIMTTLMFSIAIKRFSMRLK